MRDLIDLGSKANAIHLAYTTKLGLRAEKIDVSVQKIDGSYLDIFGMVIADCSVKNKLEKVRFFKEIFLLANIDLEVVLGMFFLTFSKADIWFTDRELVWRTYTAKNALLTTRKVEIIDKKKFAATALNEDDETFVVHVVALAKPTTMPIHPSYQAQLTALTSEKTGIPAEYSEFFDVFSSDSTTELPEHTGIIDPPIDLLDDKQPPYGSIYSLGLVELEKLKTYNEANLATSFIQPSKSPADTPILFVRKGDGSLCLCVNY